MSGFLLKLIALATMISDHWYEIIGGDIVLKYIGRISFPIFAFLLAKGFTYSKNLKNYFFRLFSFAIISQIPQWLGYSDYPLNIFFELCLGFVALYIYDKQNLNLFLKFSLISFILLFAHVLNVDYRSYGIILILLFFIFRENNIYLFLSILLLNILFFKLNLIIERQIYSILALPIIFLYNGKKGLNLKWFFYIAYPLHILILLLIKHYFY